MTRELVFSVTIKDCEVQTFSAGGKGGQHQNKTQSGVRVIHGPSGAVGEARDSRDQYRNKRSAFRRMAESEKFQKWAKLKAQELVNKRSIDDIVEELMSPYNLLIETRDEGGKWKKEG
jgi:protein subunit release factor A